MKPHVHLNNQSALVREYNCTVPHLCAAFRECEDARHEGTRHVETDQAQDDRTLSEYIPTD